MMKIETTVTTVRRFTAKITAADLREALNLPPEAVFDIQTADCCRNYIFGDNEDVEEILVTWEQTETK